MDRQIEIEKTSKRNNDSSIELLKSEDQSSENIFNSTDNSLLISENNSNESNSLLSEEITLKSSRLSESNKNELQSLDFSNKIVNSPNVIQQPEISWRREASIGNFMPAVVLLDRKELMVNEPIDIISENRLVHLAVSFSYLNVTRCLLELFNCDINIRNAGGQSALHIACNNPSQDAYLLSYLLKNDLLQVNVTDHSGLTPIFYSVLNKFNIALLALTYLKSNLTHIDNFGNNIFYFSLTSDNKFAMKFLLRHFPANNIINQSYYKNQATLADVLITTKNTSCTKHLVKYYYKDLSLESLISCKKNLDKFNVYNKFNYDMLNTLYYYKTKDFVGFFRALFRKDRSECEDHCYSYKLYNFSLMIFDYLIPNTRNILKIAMLCAYIVMLSKFFSLLLDISNSKIIEYSYFQSLVDLWQISSFFTLIICMIRFTFYKYPDNFYEESQYNLTNPEYARENVCHQIYDAMERNPLDLFFEEEICEICLIKKDKNTNHCHICNKCVKDFYFHSKLLDICFSKQNINYYIVLLSSFAAIHFYIVVLLFKVLDIETQGTDKISIYNSENYTTNLVIFFINASFNKIFSCLFFFITGVIYFQKLMTLIICLGYKTTYYNMFRYHKRSVGVIQQRGNLYYNIPLMNLTSLKDFLLNLIFRK